MAMLLFSRWHCFFSSLVEEERRRLWDAFSFPEQDFWSFGNGFWGTKAYFQDFGNAILSAKTYFRGFGNYILT
jgi:hypothetical protein